MNKWIQAAFLTLLAAGSGFAGTVTFSGTLSQDDNVVLYDFTANSSELITIQSLSYKVGGFAPTAFLFDGLGDVTQLTNGTCAQVGQDPTTLNCDDLYFQDTLGPGSFVLALAVYDKPARGLLAGRWLRRRWQPRLHVRGGWYPFRQLLRCDGFGTVADRVFRSGYNRGGFGGAGVRAGTGQFALAAERRLVDRVAAGGFRLQG